MAIRQLQADREAKLQRQREEQLKRRRDEKMRRKREQMKGVSHKILKVGRHHFQDSDPEDDDPNQQFFVSDKVVKKAAKRVYVRSVEEFFAIRNERFEGKPAIVAINDRITSTARVTQLFEDHKDDWYMQKGVTPVFEAGWEDLALRIYFPSLNQILTIVPSQVYAAFSEKDWCGIISHIAKETS
jgi:hypothetical protein